MKKRVLIDRTNPIYPSEYNFKDIYLYYFFIER